MRAKYLLVLGLALFLGACYGKVPQTRSPAPPLNKQLLTGKWKSTTEDLLVAGYEFREDGTVKVTVRGMAEPVLAHYTWSGDRTLDLEYQAPAEVQQAYKAAAKAFKDAVRDRVQAGKMPDPAGQSIMKTARDELPVSEPFQVVIEEKRPFLILSRTRDGVSFNFEKAD